MSKTGQSTCSLRSRHSYSPWEENKRNNVRLTERCVFCVGVFIHWTHEEMRSSFNAYQGQWWSIFSTHLEERKEGKHPSRYDASNNQWAEKKSVALMLNWEMFSVFVLYMPRWGGGSKVKKTLTSHRLSSDGSGQVWSAGSGRSIGRLFGQKESRNIDHSLLHLDTCDLTFRKGSHSGSATSLKCRNGNRRRHQCCFRAEVES